MWGDLAVATEAAYQKAVVKPVVGIVCSAKPKTFLSKYDFIIYFSALDCVST